MPSVALRPVRPSWKSIVGVPEMGCQRIERERGVEGEEGMRRRERREDIQVPKSVAFV